MYVCMLMYLTGRREDESVLVLAGGLPDGRMFVQRLQ